MRRARERIIEQWKDDMLSSDTERKMLAKSKLDEAERAFECLTDPRKLRDFLELINSKLAAGTVEPDGFIASLAENGNESPAASDARTEAVREAAGSGNFDFDLPLGPGASLPDSAQKPSSSSLAKEREAL